MIKVQKIRCITVTVCDLTQAQNFYTQALGFKRVGETTFTDSSYNQLTSTSSSSVQLVTLQLGDELIELIQYLDLKAEPLPKDSQSNDLWFQHLAIVVSDMDLAYEHLKSFDIEYISNQPQTIPEDNKMAPGVRAFKFRDPIDRQSLELIWFPEGIGKEKWQRKTDEIFLGIDHSAISVADTEESLTFYRDLLGMTVEGGNLNSGEVQAHLDGLPVAEVQVTPLQPIETSVGVELLDYIKPGTGRHVPQNWQANDLAHLHFILEVDDLEQSVKQLQQHKVEMVSPGIVKLPNVYRYRNGCLIRDPNGHALLLASE
ncbi:MAG: VOC family protein [Microcoleaceae cyanobacterium]